MAVLDLKNVSRTCFWRADLTALDYADGREIALLARLILVPEFEVCGVTEIRRGVWLAPDLSMPRELPREPHLDR